MRKYLILLTLLFIAPTASAFDAFKAINNLLGASQESPQTQPQPSPQPTVPDKPEDKVPTCGLASMSPIKTCELGAGFLCVNTPDLSATDKYVRLRGTIDVKNNKFSSVTVNAQHEYTKEYKQYTFDKPNADKDCWNSNVNFCLSPEGYYSLYVPLGERLGPYTLSVTAARQDTTPAEESVRVSYVVAPKLSKEDVKIDATKDRANISIDLFHGCQFCDFIGVATGGLTITVKNIISETNGGTKQLTQTSNMAASGGVFSICVPLGQGRNQISIAACNAASLINCPSIDLAALTGSGPAEEISWITPVKEFYSADTDPTIELKFKLTSKNVSFIFNRNPEINLIPDSNGIFTLTLQPETGVNIGTIRADNFFTNFSFSWGELANPFLTNDPWIKNAGGFSISKDFLTYTTRGLLNNYAKSDRFKELLKQLPIMLEKNSTDNNQSNIEEKNKIAQIKSEIPMCNAEASPNNIVFKLMREPVLGSISMPRIEFVQDAIRFTLEASNIDIRASVFADNDFNGQPDKDYLPLIIAFSKLTIPGELRVDRSTGKAKFLIISDKSDCSYKPMHACIHKPAVIVPENFVGSATKGGSFIKCDYDVDHDCEGVNILNAQTGLLSAQVLDTINNLIYCSGSSMLTYILRERFKEVDIPIKVGLRSWKIPVGLDLLSNKFSVSESGITGTVPAIVGNKEFFPQNKGYLRRPFISSNPSIGSSGNFDFGISIGEDIINALLYILTNQEDNGALDWDIHEDLFKMFDFDFVKRCDESTDIVNKSALCMIRPRVEEILGGSLTSSGYFDPKQPIMIRIRGNRNLPPRISFFQKENRQYVDLQIGDMDILFYALEVDTSVPPDKFGNLKIKYDQNGDPIIHSMNPLDTDPKNGPIVKFKLSVMAAIEISNFFTDPENPAKLAITIRPEPKYFKMIFKSVPGGNSTIIPDASIISGFDQLIKVGLSGYDKPENTIKFGATKDIEFDQFTPLGLKKLSFGKDGIQLKVEESQEFLDLFLKMKFEQLLSIAGQMQSFSLPE